MLLIPTSYVFAQVAEGGCTKVTVTNVPPYPQVYFANVATKDCKEGSGYYEGCDEDGRPACCRIIVSGWPTTARFWLEQLQDGDLWVEVEVPQFNTTFTDVPKGVYRVKCQVPVISTSACENRPNGRMCLFNLYGQFIGYWGTWENAPITYTNTVVVGATTAEDITYTFVDVPETGSEQTYDFGETVIMDASASKNYDLWWLSIAEDGPTYNRYKSNGWTNGVVPDGGILDLSSFWREGTGWEFETFHSYSVQFVIENFKCRNGIEQIPPTTWNNLKRTFFICPEGTGCRFGIREKEIIIYPNPVNNTIRLLNFDPDLDRNYVVVITDLTGKVVKNIDLLSNEVDISDLHGGMFMVRVLKEGEEMINLKLVVE